MAKVLFVNPTVRESSAPQHVPYGMALLAAIIEQHGHEFQVFDENAWRFTTDSELRSALVADCWEVIAVGGISTTYGAIKRIVGLARQICPNALIVLGGGVLTSLPREIMGMLPQVDIGVIGEAFVTFVEVLARVDESSRQWDTVLGIIYRDANDELRITPERPLLRDIDSLPYPAWRYFPLEEYWKNSSTELSEELWLSRRRLDINGSYGCSLICRFCYHLGIAGDLQYDERPDGDRDVAFTYDRELRWHSPRYIVDMVKHARKELGIDFLMFLDENLMTMHLSSGRKWLTEIADLWIAEGLQPRCIREGREHSPGTCDGVHWGGTSHAGLVDPDILKRLRESGCSYLLYGLESFSPRVLRNVGKGATAAANERALKMTFDAGIRPIPNQMIGFPDEFFDSVLDCMDAWERLGIVCKPFFATPYPGSEWFYRYHDKILQQHDGNLEAFLESLGDATDITAVISENFNAVELLGLRELMLRFDRKRIKEYEKEWRRVHGEPTFPDFVSEAKVNWSKMMRKKKGPHAQPAARGLPRPDR